MMANVFTSSTACEGDGLDGEPLEGRRKKVVSSGLVIFASMAHVQHKKPKNGSKPTGKGPLVKNSYQNPMSR
jgi:hypothetical protein